MKRAPRYRAWRFLHPDFDAPGSQAGLGLTAQGGVAMVEDAATVRQAIFLLLSTLPGERLMRPDYGCDIHRLVFAPADDTTAGLAIHSVRKALQRWEPRIDDVHIDATYTGSSPQTLVIELAYRLRATRQTDSLRLSFNLNGE